MSIQYSGSTIVNTTFTPTNKATLQSNCVTQLTAAGWSQSSGPSGGGSQNVTITIASPGVISLASHGLLANDQVVFATTGALPTGITAGTVFFVKTVLTSGTFTISSTVGGTVINTSGSQSGTQSIVGRVRMTSGLTPWSVSMIINMADNGGTCLTFSIEGGDSVTSATNSTTGGGLLNPGTGTTVYRIIASKYQAFIFQAITTPARGFVAFGTPYLPTFLQGVLTQCCWLTGNSVTDFDTTVRSSFRTVFGLATAGSAGNQQGLANVTLMEAANATNNPTSGGILISTPQFMPTGQVSSQTGTHWHDASALMQEPLIAWGNVFLNGAGGGLNQEPLIRGQLWDAVVVDNIFTGDTTTTFDGHTWWGITDTQSSLLATLFVATS